jgi:hypothetical protein
MPSKSQWGFVKQLLHGQDSQEATPGSLWAGTQGPWEKGAPSLRSLTLTQGQQLRKEGSEREAIHGNTPPNLEVAGEKRTRKGSSARGNTQARQGGKASCPGTGWVHRRCKSTRHKNYTEQLEWQPEPLLRTAVLIVAPGTEIQAYSVLLLRCMRTCNNLQIQDNFKTLCSIG